MVGVGVATADGLGVTAIARALGVDVAWPKAPDRTVKEPATAIAIAMRTAKATTALRRRGFCCPSGRPGETGDLGSGGVCLGSAGASFSPFKTAIRSRAWGGRLAGSFSRSHATTDCASAGSVSRFGAVRTWAISTSAYVSPSNGGAPASSS